MARFSTLVGNSSASTVNNWEKGNNLPNQERLEKLAILGNTTVDWIRYGELEDYVTRLLAESNLTKELNKEQFEQLVQALKKHKISYSQDLKILTTANELFPDSFEMSYQLARSEQNSTLISENFTTYKIEQNSCYRADFLPKIEDLLYDSTEKKLNATVLFQTIDLLERAKSSENFTIIPHMFTLLSAIVTDEIAYRGNPASKSSDYPKLTKQRRTRKRLPEKVVKMKYTQAKEELNLLLDEFYSEYNEK